MQRRRHLRRVLAYVSVRKLVSALVLVLLLLAVGAVRLGVDPQAIAQGEIDLPIRALDCVATPAAQEIAELYANGAVPADCDPAAGVVFTVEEDGAQVPESPFVTDVNGQFLVQVTMEAQVTVTEDRDTDPREYEPLTTVVDGISYANPVQLNPVTEGDKWGLLFVNVPTTTTDATASSAEDQSDHDLLERLRTSGDTVNDLTLSREGERSLEEVAQSFSTSFSNRSPEKTIRLFEEWGWQGSAYRLFTTPGGNLSSPRARITIHRFAGSSQSAAAADYIAQDVSDGSRDIGPDLGDGSILLHGLGEDGGWAKLIVYQDQYVISIEVSSRPDEPIDEAIDLAELFLANIAPASAESAELLHGML